MNQVAWPQSQFTPWGRTQELGQAPYDTGYEIGNRDSIQTCVTPIFPTLSVPPNLLFRHTRCSVNGSPLSWSTSLALYSEQIFIMHLLCASLCAVG